MLRSFDAAQDRFQRGPACWFVTRNGLAKLHRGCDREWRRYRCARCTVSPVASRIDDGFRSVPLCSFRRLRIGIERRSVDERHAERHWRERINARRVLQPADRGLRPCHRRHHAIRLHLHTKSRDVSIGAVPSCWRCVLQSSNIRSHSLRSMSEQWHHHVDLCRGHLPGKVRRLL